MQGVEFAWASTWKGEGLNPNTFVPDTGTSNLTIALLQNTFNL